MRIDRGTSYAVAVLLAVGLHVVVIFALTTGWETEASDLFTVEKEYYIDAVLVKENPLRPNKPATPQRTASKEPAKQPKAPPPKRQPAPKPAPRKQPEPVAVPQAATVEAVEPDADLSEEERKRMEQGLALAVLEEQVFRQAVTDDEKAQAYVAQIRRDIVQNWSRPPSARNGMEALLRVFLVPTGEVVEVTVEESSGNEAFDRSAILAVQKAEKFIVPQESRQFERNFREFTVVFRPEDLRL